MTTLYRVFPYAPQANADAPGGALYLPPQGAGRIDNPTVYSVLYMSDAASGAIAEAFGRFPEWTPEVLMGSPALPGSSQALATYQFSGAICDLDDASRLVSLELRPSEVVTRDYTRTRAWSRRIYEQREWAGVRWWSYYNPQWSSMGLWDVSTLKLQDVRMLKVADADVIAAARAILRPIKSGRVRQT